MATLAGQKIITPVGKAVKSKITFSGTVKLSGTGVARNIKGYKAGSPDTVFETTSASDGTWELSMPGGSNDKFRIIAVGADGENSEIFDKVSK